MIEYLQLDIHIHISSPLPIPKQKSVKDQKEKNPLLFAKRKKILAAQNEHL